MCADAGINLSFPKEWSAEAGLVALGLTDLDAVLDLERRCFVLPWSEGQLRNAFELETFTAFGLFGPAGLDDLIAYVSFYHVPPEMEILNMAVRPDCRRLGHGSRLIALLLEEGRRMGLNRAFLEVRISNVPAITLYEKHGFVRIGLRKGYYADNGQDALLMGCDF